MSYRIKVQFFSALDSLNRASKPFSSALRCGSPAMPTFHKALEAMPRRDEPFIPGDLQ